MPGPIAAIVAFARARASSPRSASASISSSAPFGLVRQIERVGVDVLDHRRDLGRVDPRLDPDRGQLDDLGPETPEHRREPARLSAGPGHDHLAPVQRPALEPGDLLAAGGHRTEEEDRGRLQAGLGDGPGQRRCRRDDGSLVGPGATLDRGGRLVGIAPRGDQALADARQVLDAHVEDERPGKRRQRRPVDRRGLLLGVLVPGDERDRRGVVAVGDGDPGVGGGGDPRRHSGHDLERHPGGPQGLGLLAAAAEDERVAALEADHRPPLPRDRDHPALRLVLLHGDRSRAPCRRRSARRRPGRRRGRRRGSGGRRGSRRRRRSAPAPGSSSALGRRGRRRPGRRPPARGPGPPGRWSPRAMVLP